MHTARHGRLQPQLQDQEQDIYLTRTSSGSPMTLQQVEASQELTSATPATRTSATPATRTSATPATRTSATPTTQT